jgi:hypothetical protein
MEVRDGCWTVDPSRDARPSSEHMKSRQLRNGIFATATLLSLACFVVPFNARPTSKPATLFASLLDFWSSSELSVVELLTMLLLELVVVFTVLLPPILCLELARARRPLSSRMRALLIGQGVLGVGGVILTAICMSLDLSYFMFGGDVDPEAFGFFFILATELGSAAASALFGILPGSLLRD